MNSLRNRSKFFDYIASRIITAGGVLIIISVFAIFLFILKEALPLFMPAKSTYIGQQQQSFKDGIISGTDDYFDKSYFITKNGEIASYKSDTHKIVQKKPLRDNSQSKILTHSSFGHFHSLYWDDQTVSLYKILTSSKYDNESKRSIVIQPKNIFNYTLDKDVKLKKIIIRKNEEDESTYLIALLEANKILVQSSTQEESLFGDDEPVVSEDLLQLPENASINDLTVSQDGLDIYAGTNSGNIYHWNLDSLNESKSPSKIESSIKKDSVSSLAMVLGDTSLVVGYNSGKIVVYTKTNDGSHSIYKPIHHFDYSKSPITYIEPSKRNKMLYTLNDDGELYIINITNERILKKLDLPEKINSFSVSSKGNYLIAIDRKNNWHQYKLDIPHPEFSIRSLFGKVHYESYPKKEYVWQSSSGSDDFEPKLSLIPLIFGSFKGTLYAMLFATPIAILAAIYTSHFTNNRIQALIKPVIEILGAIPSVIIGFLAALWYAPIVENCIIGFSIYFPMLWIGLILLYIFFHPYISSPSASKIKGLEFLILIPFIIITYILAVKIGHFMEFQFFDNQFKTWLYTQLGVKYDQRNCFIIAFALGLAVTPIIFTLTDDALSRVPKNLTAASLALGGSRWQTMIYVVLPSASPGIFAALMIGLGRAVGETMIVLMATGNTPILDWNIINGMRTLSANIAVEMPEAPVHGTLYRVLFLSAIFLFILTSILNTFGEIIRQNLRNKYGKF